MLHVARFALAVLATSGTAACGSDVGAQTGNASREGGASACARDTRADTYVAGLMKTTRDGALEIRLVDAQPAPPDRGANTWALQIFDAGSGAPVDGATVEVRPFMPDHGHGSALVPTVKARGSRGLYDVERIDLTMAGTWRLTVLVTQPGAAPREADFTFCIDG